MKPSLLRLTAIFCMLMTSVAAVFSRSEIPTLADEYKDYKEYAEFGNVGKVIKLLKGETIRFSDFLPSAKLTMFVNEIPDTIWLKDKPKKNPKEGKDYELRRLYHGQKQEGSYFTTEYTPQIEMAGAVFTVVDIEPYTSSGYYLPENKYRVHLRNETSGELLYWDIPEKNIKPACKVHLSNLSEKIGLKGRTLYSAIKEGYLSDTKYKDLTRHECTDVDAYLDIVTGYPKLKIGFSTVDEKNRMADHLLDLNSKNDYSSAGTRWYDERYVEDIKDAGKVYEIDYMVNLKASKDNFPFSFTFILAVVKDPYGNKVGQTITPSPYGGEDNLTPYGFLDKDDVFFIGDQVTVRGTKYYKGVLDGKAFYIPVSRVSVQKEDVAKIDSLLNSPQDVRDSFFEYAKAVSTYMMYGQRKKALAILDGYASKGISIPSWGVYDMSEYTEGTGVRFTFHNPTKKTIKYINVSFAGYNPVDDRVGKVVSKKCIGPVAPDETATYDFEYVWFTDIVQYARITSLSVQYMDGTVKTVAKPSSVEWPDEVYDGLRDSRLPDLKVEIIPGDD